MDDHKKMIEDYRKSVGVNLNNLELYAQANVTKLKKQVYVVEKMVQNKLKLTESAFFDPKQMKNDLQELKTIEHNMKVYGIEQELTNFMLYYKTKNEFDQQINELKVEGTMLKDASNLIYKAYSNFVIFKKKKDSEADEWIDE